MISGNFEDKYNTKNPISKFLVKNFILTLTRLLDRIDNPKKIAEAGMGEGYLTGIIASRFPNAQIWGSDIEYDILALARKRLKGKNINLSVENLEKLSYPANHFDLFVCCEVLEHVADPKKALQQIKRVIRGKAIVSVPEEPLWRILNMLRGKYINNFGNTPGHINHWNKEEFVKMIESSGFTILSKHYPLPWQMLLIGKK